MSSVLVPLAVLCLLLSSCSCFITKIFEMMILYMTPDIQNREFLQMNWEPQRVSHLLNMPSTKQSVEEYSPTMADDDADDDDDDDGGNDDGADLETQTQDESRDEEDVAVARRQHAGGQEITFRIVNGRRAALGDVPYQIGFKIYRDGLLRNGTRVQYFMNFCGGTLITVRAVLSAGHCFHHHHWFEYVGLAKRDVGSWRCRNLWAVAGSLTTDFLLSTKLRHEKDESKGQWRRVKSAQIHPLHFHSTHDVAVAHVYKAFHLNANVALGVMATQFVDLHQTCLASGYGCSDFVKKTDVEFLMMADLQTIPARVCNRMKGGNMRRIICTSDIVSNVCFGDSGGPLLCKGTKDPADRGKGVIAGIACAGDPTNKNSTIFTRVSKYSRKFIDEAVRNGVQRVYYKSSVMSLTLAILKL